MTKEEKEQLVVEFFKTHPDAYIDEISEETTIPKSTIQRYLQLHQKEIIPTRNITISEQLQRNKQRGKQKGGLTFFENNISLKDEQGRFTGSEKDDQKDKVEKKEKDILRITKTFLENSTSTLDNLEELLPYTRDYIYDCLTSSRTKEMVGEEVYQVIQELLRKNRYSFERKIKDSSILEHLDEIELTEIERQIMILREKGISQEEIASRLNISHTTVMEYEDRIIERFNNVTKRGQK